jgi:hypothetical protein
MPEIQPTIAAPKLSGYQAWWLTMMTRIYWSHLKHSDGHLIGKFEGKMHAYKADGREWQDLITWGYVLENADGRVAITAAGRDALVRTGG